MKTNKFDINKLNLIFNFPSKYKNRIKINLLKRICCFLDYTSVVNLAKTCKFMNKITQDEKIWKHLFEKKYGFFTFLFKNISFNEINWKELLLLIRSLIEKARTSQNYLVLIEPQECIYESRIQNNFHQKIELLLNTWKPRVINGQTRGNIKMIKIVGLFKLKNYTWEFITSQQFKMNNTNNHIDGCSERIRLYQLQRELLKTGLYLQSYQVISSGNLFYRLLYIFKQRQFIESTSIYQTWQLEFCHSKYNICVAFHDLKGGFSINVEQKNNIPPYTYDLLFKDLVFFLNFLISPFFDIHPLGELVGLHNIPNPYKHAYHLINKYIPYKHSNKKPILQLVRHNTKLKRANSDVKLYVEKSKDSWHKQNLIRVNSLSIHSNIYQSRKKLYFNFDLSIFIVILIFIHGVIQMMKI